MSKKSNTQPRVVDYNVQQAEEVYSHFWDDRNYDQRAETLLLKKYFKKYFPKFDKSKCLVDIGGNFGRFLPLYATTFGEVTILDYADNGFHLAKKSAKKENIKLHLIAADAYNLPFIDNSQTSLISIRLIHHLEDPSQFFKETFRVLKPNSLFIFQASNKNHLGLFLKSLLTFNFKVWRKDWLDLKLGLEKKDDNFTLIRNYKANYLERLIIEHKFRIIHKRSASWLRSFKLARRFHKISYPFEYALQILSAVLPLSSSNWYVLQKSAGDLDTLITKEESANFLNTLCSPKDHKLIPAEDLVKFKRKNSDKVIYFDFRN
ncbi:MAG: class I SAM-dependent methyltransferase [Candidatus Saccharibacteria bacterium]|nr:class I SAM-dependent methyltransferase [Candidatus Saccharibacteria bacterium]